MRTFMELFLNDTIKKWSKSAIVGVASGSAVGLCLGSIFMAPILVSPDKGVRNIGLHVLGGCAISTAICGLVIETNIKCVPCTIMAVSVLPMYAYFKE